MLIIRHAQITALDAAARERFLDVLEQHLRMHVPNLIESYDSAALRDFNLRIWAHALKYDLASELGICAYLNSILIFGEEFESRPDFAWAKMILEEKNVPESVKIERLKEGTHVVLERKTQGESS